MIADICSSTQLFQELGDDFAAGLVNRTLKEASAVAEAGHGEVLRSKGDDVLCIFDEPARALRSALQIHSATRGIMTRDGHHVHMRIGINSGDVILSNGDLLGDVVNMAARISNAAKPGQTLVSSATVDMLGSADSGLLRPLGAFSLRGKSGAVSLFECLEPSLEGEITQVGPPIRFPKSDRLEIVFQSHRIQLDYLLSRFLIGRAADCDLVLDHPLVSRHHAEIRYQNHEFVLTDFSTNGTELIVSGRPRVLRHSQAALRGKGSIFLGGTTYNKWFEIAFSASGGSRMINQTNN